MENTVRAHPKILIFFSGGRDDFILLFYIVLSFFSFGHFWIFMFFIINTPYFYNSIYEHTQGLYLYVSKLMIIYPKNGRRSFKKCRLKFYEDYKNIQSLD